MIGRPKVNRVCRKPLPFVSADIYCAAFIRLIVIYAYLESPLFGQNGALTSLPGCLWTAKLIKTFFWKGLIWWTLNLAHLSLSVVVRLNFDFRMFKPKAAAPARSLKLHIGGHGSLLKIHVYALRTLATFSAWHAHISGWQWGALKWAHQHEAHTGCDDKHSKNYFHAPQWPYFLNVTCIHSRLTTRRSKVALLMKSHSPNNGCQVRLLQIYTYALLTLPIFSTWLKHTHGQQRGTLNQPLSKGGGCIFGAYV